MYRIPCQLEGEEQAALFRWAQFQSGKYPELDLMFHIPNGGYRNKAEAAHLKAQGVRPGVPDLCVPVARMGYHGLYIEMKAKKNGRVSAYQQRWLVLLRENGYCAYVCNGADAAIKLLDQYMTGMLS